MHPPALSEYVVASLSTATTDVYAACAARGAAASTAIFIMGLVYVNYILRDLVPTL